MQQSSYKQALCSPAFSIDIPCSCVALKYVCEVTEGALNT